MPLSLVSANKVESLQAQLAAQLCEEPLSDPFAPELIIVPGQAMARWLNMQMAQTHGVAANIQYELAASWVWQFAATQLPDVPAQDPLSRETAAWRIFQALPALLPTPEFQSLQRYLSGDDCGVKCWQLSQRIADVFDRYQFYRPKWIRDWSAGRNPPDDAWQSLLWRHLIAELRNNHRVALLDKLQQKLRNSKEELAEIPQRISCFALSSLPPLYIEVFQSLAAHTQLTLYQHSPTDQYWGDLRSKKQKSRLRVTRAEAADYYDTGNDLLASWGRQGQAFQDLLLSDDSIEAVQWEEYQEPGTDNLLHRLQQDIFSLSEKVHPVPVDDSVQVAICHSAMRECQVLHDELLRTLQQNPKLRPEDILVMVPQISEYAPYIEAIFSRDENESRPFLPWNISDITLADEHPLISIFLQLLALPGSRFTVSEVLSYLEVPEIADRFGLDQQACNLIVGLLADGHVHWGLDAEHKQSLDLPAIKENTWQQLEERLLCAYAMQADASQEYWHDIAPLSGVEGGSAQSIGQFCLLLERLRVWKNRLQADRSALQWQSTLNEMLADLFLERSDEDDKLQQIRETIDGLKIQAGVQILSLDLVTVFLQDVLTEKTVRGRFFSGGITFCGMRPMRSLPFQVICLLGMNDQAFPRREQAAEFDLMSAHWQPGDPRKGDEDRYLLLETLLCARQKLYLSYTGRSLKDNTPCQPSVLLRQLLDFINTQYLPEDSPALLMSQRISTEFSMQPFSARNYQTTVGNKTKISHDRYWCEVANQLLNRKQEDSEKSTAAEILPVLNETQDVLELSRLRGFLGHPIAWFFKNRLRIYLSEEAANEDEESFFLDGLQAWSLKSRLASDWLRGVATSQEKLRAEGVLPHGVFAESVYVDIQEQSNELLERLVDYRGCIAEPRHINLQLPTGVTLQGQVACYRGKGLLHYSPSSVKAKNLLAIWVEHLALCAQNQLLEKECSLLISRDQTLRFSHLTAKDATEQLAMMVELYKQGMQSPLPVYPETSFAFAQAHYGSDGNIDLAKKAAWKRWADSEFSFVQGEELDAYIQLARRSVEGSALDEPQFSKLALKIYSQLLDSVEEQQ